MDKKPTDDFAKKVDEVKGKIDKILGESGLEIKYQISFPIYKIIPDEVKLAMSVLSKHGMNIAYFIDKKK